MKAPKQYSLDKGFKQLFQYIRMRSLYFIKRWFKHLFQRIWRHFDDSELWSLDSTIVKFIYPRIDEFINLTEDDAAPIIRDGLKKVVEEDILPSDLEGEDKVNYDNAIDTLAELLKNDNLWF